MSLKHLLENADWLDDATREEALLKESAMTVNIGNFGDSIKSETLIKAMQNLTYVENNYEQNNINLHKFAAYIKRYNGLHFMELSNDTKPHALLLGLKVNGFYYNIDNSINVMAGLLYPPAYHNYWPNSLKFGTLGVLIGHEFTHSFDTTGGMFDSNGDERPWRTTKSEQAFDERLNCYVDHFNNYEVVEIHRKVNGEKTKDENIGNFKN